ncbi:MAG TPA: hypothetical protein VGP93_02190 [Polyangiaceae bacterium]|jgi:hypothetical protein|nr:hypothetical protein [Polyangiaceae bacterium]
MSRGRDGFLALCALGAATGLSLWACAGSEHGPKAPRHNDARATGISKDDQSRCDYKDRPDREVSESASSGSGTPNIRRVFALLGEGEERKRVLVCREVDTNFDGVKDVVRTYNDRGEALTEAADANFDGKVDTWVTFARGRVAKVEIDKTGNGKPDDLRFYVGGKLSRVQLDTNDDGQPDVWEIYDDGKLQRRGVDLDHDGHVDRWDRDELALREVTERERRDDEEQKKKDAALPGAPGDAGATDARVSARRRE